MGHLSSEKGEAERKTNNDLKGRGGGGGGVQLSCGGVRDKKKLERFWPEGKTRREGEQPQQKEVSTHEVLKTRKGGSHNNFL